MNCTGINKDTIINNMERNMHQKLQYIPSKISTMLINNIEQTLVVDSGMATDTFNTAYGGVVTKTVANDVMQYYLQKKLPMAWWIGPFSAQNEDLENNMQDAGFVHDELDIGMYCDLDKHSLKPYKIPDMLTIKECSRGKNFADFGNVLASIFEPTCEHVKSFYKKISAIPDKSRQHLRLFVGYVNDRPVSTAGVFITDVAGIYDISTHPEMQKKGYGSAMFYTALKFALDSGFKEIVLQASEDGLGIYKRFGFKEICEFNVWSNKDKLQTFNLE